MYKLPCYYSINLHFVSVAFLTLFSKSPLIVVIVNQSSRPTLDITSSTSSLAYSPALRTMTPIVGSNLGRAVIIKTPDQALVLGSTFMLKVHSPAIKAMDENKKTKRDEVVMIRTEISQFVIEKVVEYSKQYTGQRGQMEPDWPDYDDITLSEIRSTNIEEVHFFSVY
jgi:hypothetical protein